MKCNIYLLNLRCVNKFVMDICTELISDERRKKAFRFDKADDQKRSIMAAVLLNFGLWKEYGNKIELIKLKYTKYGKPIAMNNYCYFNLSHSGCWVCCVISELPVGIDVQEVQKVNSELYKLCLTSNELSFFSRGEQNNIEEFIKVWTIKESYMKMIGRGLDTEINHIGTRYVSDVQGADNTKKSKLYFVNDIHDAIPTGYAINTKIDDTYFLSVCLPYKIRLINELNIDIKEVCFEDMKNWIQFGKKILVI